MLCPMNLLEFSNRQTVKLPWLERFATVGIGVGVADVLLVTHPLHVGDWTAIVPAPLTQFFRRLATLRNTGRISLFNRFPQHTVFAVVLTQEFIDRLSRPVRPASFSTGARIPQAREHARWRPAFHPHIPPKRQFIDSRLPYHAGPTTKNRSNQVSPRQLLGFLRLFARIAQTV